MVCDGVSLSEDDVNAIIHKDRKERSRLCNFNLFKFCL